MDLLTARIYPEHLDKSCEISEYFSLDTPERSCNLYDMRNGIFNLIDYKSLYIEDHIFNDLVTNNYTLV